MSDIKTHDAAPPEGHSGGAGGLHSWSGDKPPVCTACGDGFWTTRPCPAPRRLGDRDKENAAEPLTLEGLVRTAIQCAMTDPAAVLRDGAKLVEDTSLRKVRALLTPAARLQLIADLAAGLPEAEASARYAHQRPDGAASA